MPGSSEPEKNQCQQWLANRTQCKRPCTSPEIYCWQHASGLKRKLQSFSKYWAFGIMCLFITVLFGLVGVIEPIFTSPRDLLPELFIEDIRLGKLVEGKAPFVDIQLKNTGDVTAIDATPFVSFKGSVIRLTAEPPEPSAGDSIQIDREQPMRITIKGNRELSSDDINDIRTRHVWVYVYGRIDYFSKSGKKQTLPVCMLYDPTFADFMPCSFSLKRKGRSALAWQIFFAIRPIS